MQETSLLLTLEEISQLISHSHNPQQTLSNVVRLLQRRFGTEVCSVYLLEPWSRELVLAETVGLAASAIGRIRMRLDEGLTGLAAQQASPVVVQDAFAHPRFKYFQEAGEDPYHSFLGVPLLEAGQVTGVLVLQTVQPRGFTTDEVRMLITAASQLSPLLSEAWLLQQLEQTEVAQGERRGPEGGRTLTGALLSPGVGLGTACWSRTLDWQAATPRAGELADEKTRLDQAMERAREETERLSARIAALVGDDQGAILQAQLLILQDTRIREDLDGFLQRGASAESAVLHTTEKYTRAFEQLSSLYFRERLHDVRDVLRRILWQLRPGASEPGSLVERLVLVGEETSVTDLFSMDLDRLVAVVTERGGKDSHAAILARTLKIPMVGQISGLAAEVRDGATLLVDADRSLLYIEPSENVLAEHRARQAAVAPTPRVHPRPSTEVPCGRSRRRIPEIQANVNLLSEVRPAIEHGATAVGLYRTEFLILSRRTMISEEQQLGNYQQLLRLLAGRPANIRTFDLREEKSLPPPPDQRESGSLDWRLVLRSGAVQRVFRTQLRAILRAGTAGSPRILIPMVVSGEQLRWVKSAIEQARDELQAEGLAFAQGVPLGIMIEVPLAAMMVDEWAGDIDFLCIGTNDLMASSLGIRRDDPLSEALCDPLHPGLLRTVERIVAAARAAGRPVTVCGELAASPQGIPLLAEMGVDAISVAADQIPHVRESLEAWSARI